MSVRKIAIVLPSLALGGVEKVMVNLANAFAAKDHVVHMVLSGAQDSVFRGQLAPAVRVYDLGAPRVLKSLWPLVRYLRNEAPDILLAGQNHMNILAMWAKLLSRVKSKVFLTLHSHISFYGAGGYIPVLARAFYPLADGLIAVSEGVADDHAAFVNLPRRKIQVLLNPAITPALFTMAREPLDQCPGSPFALPYIVAVGRLAPEKDYATLLKSFAAVKDAIPHRLIILGEGESRGDLETLIDRLGLRSRVALPGYAKNPYAAISRADLLVLSSRWEGLPTVLIEALALGTKVVATDCAGAREVLRDGLLGTLVPVGDYRAMAAAIAAKLKDRAAPAGEAHLQNYWHETAADKYLDYMTANLR